MVVRTLGLIAVLLLIALTVWGFASSRRREREQDALSQQARALRAAGWREDRRSGRWSHPTKTNGELLMSEAEMVEETGSDWPEELRR
jgi:type II secretory pathway pseudopilin PulG